MCVWGPLMSAFSLSWREFEEGGTTRREAEEAIRSWDA